MQRHLFRIGLFSATLLTLSLAIVPRMPRAAEPPKDKDPALDRTRRQVQMLDDLYKTAVVMITEHYVNDVSDTAAGEIARDLFAAMYKKGWHEAHLVDATGKPVNAQNAPRDAFKRKAIEQLKKGES